MGFTKHALFIGVAIVALQAAAPADFKPARLLGDFTGSMDAAELHAKQAIQVEYEEALSKAKASGPIYQQAYSSLFERSNDLLKAYVQMEAALQQYQAQAVAGAQGGEQLVGNLADMMCAYGTLFDPSSGAQKACGVGDQVKQKLAAELPRAIVGAGNRMSVKFFEGIPDPATLMLRAEQR